jgi:hypothetical protein
MTTTDKYYVLARIGSVQGLKPPAVPLEGVDANTGDCGGADSLDEALTLAANYPSARVYSLDAKKYVS